MILNSFYLQGLIPDFESVMKESGILILDQNSMDKIIDYELIDEA